MEISTRIQAAGWLIFNKFKIVAPSFEITCSLSVSTNLSIPQGPKVVLRISATAQHALILLII